MDMFDKMMFGIHGVPSDQSIIEEVPGISNHKKFLKPEEWGEILDDTYGTWDQVLRFIFYAYDLNSPFLQESSATKRKNLACKAAGWDVEKMERSLLHSGEIIQPRISYFFKIQNQEDLVFLVSASEYYYNLCEILRTPLFGLDDDKLVRATEVKAKLLTSGREAYEIVKNIRLEIRRRANGIVEELEGAGNDILNADSVVLGE